MTHLWRSLGLLLLIVGTSACGQKGPLFLPGDPSQITPPPSDEEREEEEDEQTQR